MAVPDCREHFAAYRRPVHGADGHYPYPCPDFVPDSDAVGNRSSALGDHLCGEPCTRDGDDAYRFEPVRHGGGNKDADRHVPHPTRVTANTSCSASVSTAL